MALLIRKKALIGSDERRNYSHSLHNRQIMVVGLGNPGSQYSQTRHNIGFMMVDKISQHYNCQSFVKKTKFKAETVEIVDNDCKIHLMKPQTFMNNSGLAVHLMANWLKIDKQQIYVIVDQVNLNWGVVEVKTTQTQASHNGLRSIRQHLKCQDINLFQVGIGPKQPVEMSLSDFVLGRFGQAQIDQIDQVGQALIELTQEATVGDVGGGRRLIF